MLPPKLQLTKKKEIEIQDDWKKKTWKSQEKLKLNVDVISPYKYNDKIVGKSKERKSNLKL